MYTIYDVWYYVLLELSTSTISYLKLMHWFCMVPVLQCNLGSIMSS